MALQKYFLIVGNSCHGEVSDQGTVRFSAPQVLIAVTHAMHQPARCWKKGKQAGNFCMCEKELPWFWGALLAPAIW